MRTYIAFYNSKQYQLEAESAYQAQQKAVAFFKPAKSKTHMVHVHLADTAISTASL